jgi:protein-tyrosine-phosphatase
MAGICIEMIKDASNSFVEENCDIARKNIQAEEAVDLIRTQLNEKIAGLYQERKISFAVFEPLLTIIRRFERVSDQARNISMESLYLCTGEYSRHPNTQTFRILFIDRYNSCLSQIAEAVSNSLNLSKFIFSSAGIEPKPVDNITIDFMKSKGMDISRSAAKSLTQVPHLDYYQVLVALSPEAKSAFPQAPRKVIMLDWSMEDPSLLKADSKESAIAFENAFNSIKTKIKELTGAVTGTKDSR